GPRRRVPSPYNATIRANGPPRPAVVRVGPPRPFLSRERLMTRSPWLDALSISALVVPAAGAAEIPKPPDAGRIKNQVYQMHSGTLRVADPDKPAADATRNRAAIKTVAEWLAFTIATPPYNGEPVPREDKTPAGVERTMSILMQDAEAF